MSEMRLSENQPPLSPRAQELVKHLLNNEELLAQVRASLEAIERGERGIPFREIQEEARKRREEQ